MKLKKYKLQTARLPKKLLDITDIIFSTLEHITKLHISKLYYIPILLAACFLVFLLS